VTRLRLRTRGFIRRSAYKGEPRSNSEDLASSEALLRRLERVRVFIIATINICREVEYVVVASNIDNPICLWCHRLRPGAPFTQSESIWHSWVRSCCRDPCSAQPAESLHPIKGPLSAVKHCPPAVTTPLPHPVVKLTQRLCGAPVVGEAQTQVLQLNSHNPPPPVVKLTQRLCGAPVVGEAQTRVLQLTGPGVPSSSPLCELSDARN
jgi:hypothetical protein